MASTTFFAVYIPPHQTEKDEASEGAVFETLPQAVDFVKKFKNFNPRFKCLQDHTLALEYAKNGRDACQSNDGPPTFSERLDSPDPRRFSYGVHHKVCVSDLDAVTAAGSDKHFTWSMERGCVDNNCSVTQIVNCGSTREPSDKELAAAKLSKKSGDVTKKSSPCIGIVDEKPLAFAAPSRTDLANLRKSIERMDEEEVLRLISQNPRFLVNCCSDSPTILFEGCRYNALHVAAKSGNLHACELILRLLDDSAYVSALYPEDSAATCDRRRRFLCDMFVNTPDKALHETPLHFAAKNGHTDVVRLLYSLPICQRQAKNKYGETAAILAKNRRKQKRNEENAEKSLPFFCIDDDEYVATLRYVALYRVDDFSTPPIVQEPCVGFPSTLLNAEHSIHTTPIKCTKRDEDRCQLVAYAGPMNANTAQILFLEWSSKKTPLPKENAHMESNEKISFWKSPAYAAKRCDLHKGAERLGRELARRHNTCWREFWAFLKKFCDLSSTDGLTAFENFFREKFDATTTFYPDAETLTKKLLALPSPFFDDLPRTPKKCVKTKLNFCCKFGESDDLFYDSLDYNELSESDSTADVEHCETNLGQNCELFATPPETPPALFIGGSQPTKADQEAFEALEGCQVDRHEFPFVKRWLQKMHKSLHL